MQSKEHGHPPELTAALMQAYAETFIQRWDGYALQLDDGKYVYIKRPLTPLLLMKHVLGALTLGAYALDQESQGSWLCLDADQEHSWQALVRTAQQLHTAGIIPYLEASRRGGHLWLFTSPMPGSALRRFGRHLLHHYHLPAVEMYPKQDVLKEGPGSLVRLPLGIHRKSNQRYSFLTPAGLPFAATIRQQMAHLAQPERIPTTFIDFILAQPIPQITASKSHISHIRRSPGAGPLSERLKQAISVADFVGQYVALDAQGKGLCPFHDDQVQSFQVNAERNYWSCYAGCGGGSLIDFWMKWRQVQGHDSSFTATITDLASILL